MSAASRSDGSTPDLSGLPGVERLGTGKVRALWLVGDDVLLVASDRISAFDVVLPTAVPDKGRVLTAITEFWLDHLAGGDRHAHGAAGIVPDHRVTVDVTAMPDVLAPFTEELAGRAMLCRRADVVPIECVARGYLAGSGWVEYTERGTVCGIPLPDGLEQAQELAEPIFTPTTKATRGHDEALSFDEVVDRVGGATAERLRDVTLSLYGRARDHARTKGIIVADTKFELGWVDGELTIVDEVLTPDSSRFWPAREYRTGISPPSFDKQIVRDHLAGLQDWDRTPPGPALPEAVVARTRARYVDAYEQLSGRSFADWPGGDA